ncbi:MAG: MlaA family lipoprotein [Pararobbsia sp.]
MNVRHPFRLGSLAFALGLAACSTVRTPAQNDPLEGMNRAIFTFNDTVDRYSLRPIAQGYQWALPQPVRSGITNVFSNVGDVYTAANELLQLRITDAVSDIMRVAINTFWGLGGLFDIASKVNLPKHSEDFGQTLGHYGVPPGPYLVLPLLGPSDVRDGLGTIVDFEADPTSFINPVSIRNYVFVVRLINTRANLLGASDLLSNAALDKYSFVRDAYVQRRAYLLHGAGGASPPLPTYDDVGPTDGAGAASPAGGATSTGTGAAAAGAAASATSGTPPAPGATPATPNVPAPDGTPAVPSAPMPAASGASAEPGTDAVPATPRSGAPAVTPAVPAPAAVSPTAPMTVPAAPGAASEPIDTSVPGAQMVPPTLYFSPSLRLR